MQRSRSTTKIISLLALAIVFMALLAVQAGTQQIASAQSATAAANQPPTATPTLLPSTEGARTIWADELRVKVLDKLGKDLTATYNVPGGVEQGNLGAHRTNATDPC